MPSAASLTAKLDKVLTKAQICDREVYKRKVYRTGGDSVTGEGVTTYKTDSKLEPTPAVTAPDYKTSMMLCGAATIPITDYVLLVSATSLTKDDLTDKDVLLVFKEEINGQRPREEECSIIKYIPVVYGNAVVCWTVQVRSTNR